MKNQLIIVIFLSLFFSFILQVQCQQVKQETKIDYVNVCGELHVDSLIYFSNPYAQDPLMIKKTYPFAHKFWRKSFQNSALRGFWSTHFDSLYFSKATFSKYDQFTLRPNSYLVLDVLSVIEDMFFPYIDSTQREKIENSTRESIWNKTELSKHYFNDYEYLVYHFNNVSFLEIIVYVPLFNYYFSKHVLTDPPSCLFCNSKNINSLYVKVLIPMMEQ